MLLLLILIIMLLLLSAFIICVVGTLGAGAIIVFGDVIVCIGAIILLIRHIIKKRSES